MDQLHTLTVRADCGVELANDAMGIGSALRA
jgi:hypothetical protein